jgi:hypothetical protein
MKVFNLRVDKETGKYVNTLLATPRFTRADLLAVTQPRIDSSQLKNWQRRGILNLDYHAAFATAEELEKIVADLKANAWRRYTGSNMLQCMILCVISHSALPFSLAPQIFELALQRVLAELMEAATGENVILVIGKPNGRYEVVLCSPSERPDDGEWHTCIEIDRIIGRFLIAAAPRGVGRMTVAMDKDVELRSPRK